MAVNKKKGSQTKYCCRECGSLFLQWVGRCPRCGEWDSLDEEKQETETNLQVAGWVVSKEKPQLLTQVALPDKQGVWATDVNEFDRVIGGGWFEGSFGLLGGAPGVGKSTLILQLLSRLAKIDKKVLYVSGEESASQIKQRADRLQIEQSLIYIVSEACLETISNYISEYKPDFIVIDSIQTLYTQESSSIPGSVTQIKESASLLMRMAKNDNLTVLLVGHITKEGDLAGPKTLEHMVDYVLYLEGEKQEQNRILRAVKNRFSSIQEVGLFRMTQKGLAQVEDATRFFSETAHEQAGCSNYLAIEGGRGFFLEVQALVGETKQNYPVRTTVGFDKNRLLLLLAVLEKHTGMDFSRNDIYINLAGGFRLLDSCMDLAVIAALISSHTETALPHKSLYLGEVSLTGSIRKTSLLKERVLEASRYGFKHIFLPASVAEACKKEELTSTLHVVKSVADLMAAITK